MPVNKSISVVNQTKCLYTNAPTMGNKQEEQESLAQSQGYCIISLRCGGVAVMIRVKWMAKGSSEDIGREGEEVG